MSQTLHRTMMYACATMLLVSLHTTHNHVTASPTTWSEQSATERLEQDKEAYFHLLQAILNRLQDVKEKRTQADGGFFSRHDAMNDYLQSAFAKELASDLYGPGKRK